MIRTQIIATLGPASNSEAVLRKMFASGLDMVRLNFSHGVHAEHVKRIALVRGLNEKMGRAIKIMQDLEGYRIRIGRLRRPIQLKKHSQFYLTQEDIIGDEKEIPFGYKGALRRIKKGTLIYIDDGKIMLTVRGIEKKRLKAEALVPGLLKEHKGMNFPGVKFDFEALTAKDKKDAEVAITHKLDYVAQSFVRSAKDIKRLKDIIKPRHNQCRIFAKVENSEALDNIEGVIEEADGIVIARGDLGVSVPIYKVPVIQKKIIEECTLSNKPVVVATQMLDSMTEESIPTRAEVSDVANAVFDGATHVMLSGETAVGKHPHKAVAMMNEIIKYAEEYQSKTMTSSKLI